MPLGQDNIWLARGVVEGHAEKSLQNGSVMDDIAGASKLMLCHFFLEAKNAVTEISTNSQGKWFWTWYLQLKKQFVKNFLKNYYMTICSVYLSLSLYI